MYLVWGAIFIPRDATSAVSDRGRAEQEEAFRLRQARQMPILTDVTILQRTAVIPTPMGPTLADTWMVCEGWLIVPDRRRRDADNLWKVPLDALVHALQYVKGIFG